MRPLSYRFETLSPTLKPFCEARRSWDGRGATSTLITLKVIRQPPRCTKKSEPTPRIHRMCFFSWVGRVCRLELPPIPPGIDLLLFAARGAHA